jgi:hypothetical protein
MLNNRRLVNDIIIVNCAESVQYLPEKVHLFQGVVGWLFQTARPAIGKILFQKLYVFRMTDNANELQVTVKYLEIRNTKIQLTSI